MEAGARRQDWEFRYNFQGSGAAALRVSRWIFGTWDRLTRIGVIFKIFMRIGRFRRDCPCPKQARRCATGSASLRGLPETTKTGRFASFAAQGASMYMVDFVALKTCALECRSSSGTARIAVGIRIRCSKCLPPAPAALTAHLSSAPPLFPRESCARLLPAPAPVRKTLSPALRSGMVSEEHSTPWLKRSISTKKMWTV